MSGMDGAEFRDEISPWSAQSAAVGIRARIYSLITILVIFIIFAFFPKLALLAAYGFGYMVGGFVLLMALLRFIAIGFLLRSAATPKISEEKIKQRNTPWPRYTILVPLYKEAHMVRPLMDALSALDYPKDKLDIIMVTEANDPLTTQTVKRNLRAPFRLYETPSSHPQTKPKALNKARAAIPAALIGEYVTIYDAEDKPHPLQLKAAVHAFENDCALAAVQAPLSFHNDKTNILTALFGLEYASLFEVWNPALVKFGLPFTLGGTSNHISRDILDRAGGWDAYNVTEDADLSFKINALSINGKRARISVIPYGTEEEIVDTIKDWSAQRSRWLKGFMQAWAIHKRPRKAAPDNSPYTFASKLSRWLSMPITLGATLLLSFIHVPSLIMLAFIIACNFTSTTDIPCPPIFYVAIVLGYSSAILMGVAGAIKAGRYHLIKYAILMPFYWLLYFLPALIAAWEYITAPSYWRKTNHKGKIDGEISQQVSPKHLAAE